MDEIVDAVIFMLENGAVNGVDLIVDGGWHCADAAAGRSAPGDRYQAALTWARSLR